MKFKDGYMVSSGDPVRIYLDSAVRHVLLRQGVLGIKVGAACGVGGVQGVGGGSVSSRLRLAAGFLAWSSAAVQQS